MSLSGSAISETSLSVVMTGKTVHVTAVDDSLASRVIATIASQAGLHVLFHPRGYLAARPVRLLGPEEAETDDSLALTCRYSTLASSQAGRAAWVALLLRPTSGMGMPRIVVHASWQD